jgi:hypothetical protein
MGISEAIDENIFSIIGKKHKSLSARCQHLGHWGYNNLDRMNNTPFPKKGKVP